MADVVCVNSACGRGFPRAVNFCPWCGTRQPGATAPAYRPADAGDTQAVGGMHGAAPPHLPPASPGRTAAPQPPVRASTPPPPTAEQAAASWRAALEANNGKPASPPPGATQRGASAPGRPEAQASRPPLRQPVSKTTWVLVALLVLAIWLVIKPEDRSKKFEPRVQDAIALTKECRISAARAELTSLRSEKALPEQLQRLQDAIAAAAPECDKARQRARAWTDLQPTINSAIKANKPELAASRLSAFTKKWGEDRETDAVFARIDTLRAEQLLDDANACLKQGNRQCAETKLRQAEQLNRPEVTARLNVLKDELSRLLESTLLQ